MQPIGYLSRQDPLYGWLTEDILPQIGVHDYSGSIKVFKANASNQVYIYEVETIKKYRVVGKFYGEQEDSYSRKQYLIKKELENIELFKKHGFGKGSHRMPRILGYNLQINCILVTEYMQGETLEYFIQKSVFDHVDQGLYDALSELAHFLYTLHSRTTDYNTGVDFRKEQEYFLETLNKLKQKASISRGEVDNLISLSNRWDTKPEMWSPYPVLVHGDATPGNFLFSGDPKVIILDLERCKMSDPAFDTGRVAAELKHQVMAFTGDGWKAEPFITHFYRQYSSHSNNPEGLFKQITQRNPYYQAVTELRIAKNYWVTKEHRKNLIIEAKKCLQY